MKKFVSIVALVVFLVTLAGAACASGGTGSAPACNAGAITVNATISMSNTGSITGTGKVTNLSGEDGWTFDMTIEVQKLQNGSWVMASRQKKTAKKIEISYQAKKGTTYRIFVKCVAKKGDDSDDIRSHSGKKTY